jgi:hypothetical protein
VGKGSKIELDYDFGEPRALVKIAKTIAMVDPIADFPAKTTFRVRLVYMPEELRARTHLPKRVVRGLATTDKSGVLTKITFGKVRPTVLYMRRLKQHAIDLQLMIL